jgi:superfamily II DNA or RNA helicase
MVQIVVDNCFSQIAGALPDGVAYDLSKRLSYTNDAARYSFAYKVGKWDGRVRLLTKNLRFPSGLLGDVLSTLASYSIQPQVIDQRVNATKGDRVCWMGPTLRDYQDSAVDKALSAGRGMVKMATGAGKSNIIAKLCAEYNTDTVIYVVSLDLLEQIKQTVESCLGIEVGLVGGGYCDIKKITVCSVWSAASAFNVKASNDEEDVRTDDWKPSEIQKKNIREMVEQSQLLILDEAQFAAAESIQTLVQNSHRASHRFGFSGTPWRSDGADILLTAAFGKNIVDVRASDLIELGWLVEPHISFKDIPANLKVAKTWADVKRDYIVNNQERNEILMQGTSRLLDMGRKPLILFREIKHGKILESMLPNGTRYEMVTGALTIEERESIKARFRDGKLDLLLASSVFDQGIDLTALDALILAGGGKSTGKALQRIGRVIRGNPGKKNALVLETWDQCHFVNKHSKIRYDAYGWESRFRISAEAAMRSKIG